MLMLFPTPWLLFENEIYFFKFNTALAIPNVATNNTLILPPTLAFKPESVPNTNTTNSDENRPSFLKVIVRVDNTGGGTAKPSDFWVRTYGDNHPQPFEFDGSENGTVVAMNGQGAYSIDVFQRDSVTTTYGKSFSGDCKLDSSLTTDYASSGEADGTINSGDRLTCTVTMIFPGF